jgi:hypothetical protein
MTQDELRRLYTEAVKIARAELRQRQWVFRDRPDMLKAKVAEIERLLLILETMKDALKPYVDAEFEQPALLDVPRKGEYR